MAMWLIPGHRSVNSVDGKEPNGQILATCVSVQNIDKESDIPRN